MRFPIALSFPGCRRPGLSRMREGKRRMRVRYGGRSELTEEEKEIVETVTGVPAGAGVSDGLDIPVVLNDAVNLYIKYLRGPDAKSLRAGLSAQNNTSRPSGRSSENGLPEDLVYLAMIESGFV